MLAKQRYAWTRYWYPRGSKLELTDDGYLPDPSKISEAFVNREITTLSHLARMTCTIGLGELGSGKSQAFEDARAEIDEAATSPLERSREIDLRDVASQDRFERDVAAALTTIDDSMPRHVFIDGFDECLLRLSVVKTDLIKQLHRYGTKNLHLRIACRTAEWPPTLEEDLRELFGNANVAIYELAPLTRRDVETAARANDLDPALFLKQIGDAFAAPFAIRPVTLEFLLGYARRDEPIPRERSRLYEDGCRELCRETLRREEAQDLEGRLIDRERLAIARRIAAQTLITGRPIIEFRRGAKTTPRRRFESRRSRTTPRSRYATLDQSSFHVRTSRKRCGTRGSSAPTTLGGFVGHTGAMRSTLPRHTSLPRIDFRGSSSHHS